MSSNSDKSVNSVKSEFYVDALHIAANINDTLLSGVVNALVSPRLNNKSKPNPKTKHKLKLKPNLIPDALRSIMGELLDATPVSSERLSELERKVVAADALDHEKDEVLKIIAQKRVSTRIPFL